MSERDFDEERRMRRAAVARFGQVPEPDGEDAVAASGDQKPDEDDNAASQRIEQQALWVDLQVRRAIDRGDFANLPGAGKPMHLPPQHDPDWWVKRLIEREQITGVAPPAIGLRQEDAELDGTIDREWAEDGVRRVVEDFNRRVVEARRQLTGGPPVVTKTRDPDVEVDRWRERRAAAKEAARLRRAAAAAQARAAEESHPRPPSLLRRVLRARPR
jgi:DnaJ-like protein